MFEDEPSTLKQKITRLFIGLFLSLLVLMLLFQFIQEDAKQSALGAVTGQSSTKAGSVAGRSIPIDYFNAARQSCYSRYQQQYGRDISQNPEFLNSCAFSMIKELYIGNDIAEAVGFKVSETYIKRELAKQAHQMHKEASAQAGYAEEDTRSVQEIYQQLYRSAPMAFQVDLSTYYFLFNTFVDQTFKPSASEQNLESEAKRAKISFRVVAFSEVDLLNRLENTIQISDLDLKTEYDREVKEGNLSKDASGNFPSFETRKPLLLSKLKFDRKRKEVETWKNKIAAKATEPNGLEAIANETGMPIELVSNASLSDLKLVTSNRGNSYRLANSPKFWEALGNDPFGKKLVLGPFNDNDKQVFVEFGVLSFGEPLPQKPEDQMADFLKQRQLYSFFLEINQSLAAEYNVEKKNLLTQE
ncbi:SurA N-terminal domain-containing protein [Leptospira sp. 96542]|nr:SurA N-terminal domain-containing protein [Leptospira sp. 96542]